MAPLSLREAAQQVGRSKSTILRAIQAGRLSAGRTDAGGHAIDPSELVRVYPPERSTQRSVGQDAPGDATGGTGAETAVLDAEVDGLKQLLQQMRDQLTDLKDDRDGWRQQAENAQRLLTATTPGARRRWWQRKAG